MLNKTTTLTEIHLRLLKDTSLIDSSKKFQLLQMSTESRIVTDIFLDKVLVNEKEIEKLLDAFPFKYFKGTYFNNLNSNTHTIFYRICLNQNLCDYVSNYWQTFDFYEQNTLYGYPVTSTLATANIIERANLLEEQNKLSIAMKLLGPQIYSKKFFEQEKEYYENIWEEIKAISPKIITQTEDYYKNWHKNFI